MKPTVILPYSSQRTTGEDIAQIADRLFHHAPTAQLLAFHEQVPPIALADAISPQTITVTLDNNIRSTIFDVIPGPKFFASRKTKTRLVEDMIAGGLPMPHSMRFSPEATLDEAAFGPYTAIKTSALGTWHGTGIHVFKTRDFEMLRDRLMSIYRQDIEAGFPPLLQQYIPSGPHPNNTTVTTFLGAPIVCFKTTAPKPFFPEKLTGLSGGEATSNSSNDRTRKLVSDDAMVAMAKRVCAVFPETSVLSIDMVRCIESGKLYCIEANMGNLGILSAPFGATLRKDLGGSAVHRQFMSYDTIARRMAETLNGLC
jgi:hypothetical protein